MELNNLFVLLGITLTSYILAKYTYIASRFYPYLYSKNLGYFKIIQIELYSTFSIFRSLGKVKIKKRKYFDLFLWYIVFFGFIYYKLNLDFFYIVTFSILFIGSMIDLKKKIIPENYLILGIVPYIVLNIYEGFWGNVGCFFITFGIAYLVLYIQLKLNKCFFIGIQDIKLYGLYFLIFRCDLSDFLDVMLLCDMIGLFFGIYFLIRYKTQEIPFGPALVIGFLLNFK